MLDIISTFNTNPELLTADEKSGAGQFSDVFLTPCGEYAIKHGNHGFSDGWLLFAAKLLTLPEDERPWWAPVIHSLRVDMDTGSFTALVRAYEPNDFGPTTSGFVSDLKRGIEIGIGDLDKSVYYEEWSLLFEADEFDNAPIECVEFLHEIEKEADVPLYFDMPENSMWDRTTERLVLNDPCCVKYWRYAKSDMRYVDKFRTFITKCAEKATDMKLVGEAVCLS